MSLKPKTKKHFALPVKEFCDPSSHGQRFIILTWNRTDVFSSKNLKKRFLVCTTVITIILSLLIPAVTLHIAADVAATVLSF